MALPSTRVTLQPIPFNLAPLAGVFPLASTPGYDLGSPSAITAWGAIQGVRVPNNGQVMLYWASGATLPGIHPGCWLATRSGTPARSRPPPPSSSLSPLPAPAGWAHGPPATYNVQQTGNTWPGAINSQVAVAADVGCVLIDFHHDHHPGGPRLHPDPRPAVGGLRCPHQRQAAGPRHRPPQAARRPGHRLRHLTS